MTVVTTNTQHKRIQTCLPLKIYKLISRTLKFTHTRNVNTNVNKFY